MVRSKSIPKRIVDVDSVNRRIRPPLLSERVDRMERVLARSPWDKYPKVGPFRRRRQTYWSNLLSRSERYGVSPSFKANFVAHSQLPVVRRDIAASRIAGSVYKNRNYKSRLYNKMRRLAIRR